MNWKYEAAAGIGASPACTGERIFGADYEGNVFCLSSADGSLIWKYGSGAKVVSSPVISGRTLIAATMDGRMISLGIEKGDRLWSLKIGDQVWATPAVGEDYIIAATTDGSLIRLTPGGKALWRVAPGGKIHSSPLVLEKEVAHQDRGANHQEPHHEHQCQEEEQLSPGGSFEGIQPTYHVPGNPQAGSAEDDEGGDAQPSHGPLPRSVSKGRRSGRCRVPDTGRRRQAPLGSRVAGADFPVSRRCGEAGPDALIPPRRRWCRP